VRGEKLARERNVHASIQEILVDMGLEREVFGIKLELWE
jgi:hypothetical protein